MKTISRNNLSIYKLNDIYAYSTPDALYVSKDDHTLLKITGEDRSTLEEIIEQFSKSNSLSKIYDNLKTKLLNNKSHFQLLINYLIESNILITDSIKSRKKTIVVIGNFLNFEKVRSSFKEISSTNVEYEILTILPSPDTIYEIESKIKKIDAILLFSPLLFNKDSIENLSNFVANHNIPLFHAGLQSLSFTLGPIFDSRINPTTLLCYYKRKLTTMEKPDKYLEIINIPAKKTIVSNALETHRFYGILINFITYELEGYFQRNKYNLIAKEIEYDMVSHRNSESRILRVLNQKAVYSPFNI